jgi:hypothetical protein
MSVSPTQGSAQPIPYEAPKKSSWRNTCIEVVAGGTAGVAGIVAAAPLFYFKMYAQQKANDPHVVFQKNPIKWYVGTPTLAAAMFPVIAFQFFVNDALRRKLSHNGERELSQREKLACSVTTGALSTAIVCPQELIWTQQQAASAKDGQKLSASAIAQKIWREHGIKGFYRAGAETMGREMVCVTVLTNLVAEFPLLAPIIGAALSQPLDGRKTNKQADFAYKASVRELFRLKAFSGLLIGRIPAYIVFMNVAPYVKNGIINTFSE